MQVAGDLATASKLRSVRIAQIYGGRAYEPQIDQLRTGVDVVVGTPGRMIDLLNQGHLDLRYVRTVVLDEADEMLDLGFLPDVEKLLATTPESRHTMLFSATMPGAVVALARRYMTQPTHIRAAEPDDGGATVKATAQFLYRAHALDKVEVLARILQAEGRGLTIVFARTKRTAAKVSDELRDRGFAAGAIHGDLGQGAREQALRAFRNGKIDILVATDVAARGIDVDDVTHVVNYQCPEDEKIYLHRIGRTGRAGKTGIAVTFVDWDDMPRWGMIDKSLDLGFPEPVETYSNSPHLYSDLSIPEGTKGRLPSSSRTREGLDAETLEDLGETGKKPVRVLDRRWPRWFALRWFALRRFALRWFRSGSQGGGDRNRSRGGQGGQGGQTSKPAGQGSGQGSSQSSGQGANSAPQGPECAQAQPQPSPSRRQRRHRGGVAASALAVRSRRALRTSATASAHCT